MTSEDTNVVQVKKFGTLSETNDPVSIITLTNSRGAEVELINFGASIRSLKIPTKNGLIVDVVLGFENLDGYEKNAAYLGCVVGRVCNRIKAGQFTLDGQTYQLAINNGPNHLHGGIKNFSHRLWKITDSGNDFITFELFSLDDEEGYPSAVRVTVTYRFPTDSIRLIVEFDAVNEGNKTTPINLTNHSYFNLNGVQQKSDIKNQQLAVFSDSYLPTDENHLVTGQILPVEGTVYDLRSPAVLGQRLDQLLPKSGYDNHFCNTVTTEPKKLAVLSCADTGISMTVSGTQPGVQIYTAQYMDEKGGKYGQSYGKHAGIALETQHYPDSVNKPDFPSIWLKAGEKYHQVTIFEFEVTDKE